MARWRTWQMSMSHAHHRLAMVLVVVSFIFVLEKVNRIECKIKWAKMIPVEMKTFSFVVSSAQRTPRCVKVTCQSAVCAAEKIILFCFDLFLFFPTSFRSRRELSANMWSTVGVTVDRVSSAYVLRRAFFHWRRKRLLITDWLRLNQSKVKLWWKLSRSFRCKKCFQWIQIHSSRSRTLLREHLIRIVCAEEDAVELLFYLRLRIRCVHRHTISDVSIKFKENSLKIFGGMIFVVLRQYNTNQWRVISWLRKFIHSPPISLITFAMNWCKSFTFLRPSICPSISDKWGRTEESNGYFLDIDEGVNKHLKIWQSVSSSFTFFHMIIIAHRHKCSHEHTHTPIVHVSNWLFCE